MESKSDVKIVSDVRTETDKTFHDLALSPGVCGYLHNC